MDTLSLLKVLHSIQVIFPIVVRKGSGVQLRLRCMLSGCVASGTGLCITSCSVFRTVRLLLKYPVLFG